MDAEQEARLNTSRDRLLETMSEPHEPRPPIDGTPDAYFPLRILRAYRESCNHQWGSSDGWTEQEMRRFKGMNDVCDARAKILDAAIAILEREM